jgi:hypothetical protein
MTNSWKPIGDAAARVIDELSRKRADLALLRARYDSGAVSAAIYVVIKRIECDIAWKEHKRKRATRIEQATP